MRHGFTTGSCAAAVAKGAVTMLVQGHKVSQSTIWIPAGFHHTFELCDTVLADGEARCSTVKDAGDDPDATDKAVISATATWRDEPGLELDGGEGVGRVTKAGLPIPVGQAAINPVPRRMIAHEVQEVLDACGAGRGVKVVISVKDGEEIAKKTLNSRLGILGGISILGTRGTVVPYSTSAYKASIVQALQVAKASGCKHVALTTGGSSEKAAMSMLPDLPEEAFIQMGEFVGFALKQAKRLGITRMSLVGMLGKFSKVAQGVMMVHSKSAPVDFSFLARVAEEAGASSEQQQAVLGANTAMQVGEWVTEWKLACFFDLLSAHVCRQAVQHAEGGIEVETVLITMKGATLGRAECGDGQ